ncbi:hypothetical protein B5E80_15215 [Flavonifractor sp. An135]|nr:hypothetical protein [Flavonifractor sp. An135]OUQ22146.1 hypothetical protein B5E80_15215 [Flavonifractor sp. An135]
MMMNLPLGLAIKEIIHQCRTTQMALAEKAGYKYVSAVTAPIARNDMHVSSLVRMAEALGYDLVLVKRENAEGHPSIRIASAGKGDKPNE